MKKAREVYTFNVVAGQGLGSARAIADGARRIAEDFFGEIPFDLHIDISGRKGQWIIEAQASADVLYEHY